jgi:hypothetical protein
MKKNLNGYGKQFKGNHSDEPTDKQKNIIKKLRAYYGFNKIPECKTKGEAWKLINKYQHVVKYDKIKNEFYIEDNVVNNKTHFRLINEDEYECLRLVKQMRDLLTGRELDDYEELIKYIGDYSIIKEVSQYMIEQRIKAETEIMEYEEPDYDDYDLYDPQDMSTWDDEDWINFELEH